MTALKFQDRKWAVITQSWSVAAKPGKCIEVCYCWIGGADGISRCWFEISIEDFSQRLSSARGLLDLGTAQ